MSLGAVILPNGLPDPTMPQPEEVEVIESLHRPTSYRLRFGMNIVAGDLPLLADPRLGPESELAILVSSGVLPQMLVKGPVTGQDIRLVHGGEGSRLQVLGGDQGLAMDREDKAAVWSNQTDSLAVTAIVASYGMIPDVEPTTTLHTDLKHALVQRETDLAFVRRLARRNGFWFWIDNDPIAGIGTAHFKRPPVLALPAADLRINLDASNLDSLSLQWHSETPASADLTQLDLGTKAPIPGMLERSTLTGLALQGLADVAPSRRQAHFSVPVDDAADLLARAEGALTDHGWFVQARATTRGSVLKGVVRAHSLVTLSGAGLRHSGRYLVARVEHHIDPDDHKMTIDLIRNGWNLP